MPVPAWRRIAREQGGNVAPYRTSSYKQAAGENVSCTANPSVQRCCFAATSVPLRRVPWRCKFRCPTALDQPLPSFYVAGLETAAGICTVVYTDDDSAVSDSRNTPESKPKRRRSVPWRGTV